MFLWGVILVDQRVYPRWSMSIGLSFRSLELSTLLPTDRPIGRLFGKTLLALSSSSGEREINDKTLSLKA